VFGIFAALAEFERELIAERTIAGLASGRARRGQSGPPVHKKPANLPVALAAMGEPDSNLGAHWHQHLVTRQTLSFIKK
ncbi:recombinase family protein, partial [Enterobacter hormaechei]